MIPRASRASDDLREVSAGRDADDPEGRGAQELDPQLTGAGERRLRLAPVPLRAGRKEVDRLVVRSPPRQGARPFLQEPPGDEEVDLGKEIGARTSATGDLLQVIPGVYEDLDGTGPPDGGAREPRPPQPGRAAPRRRS